MSIIVRNASEYKSQTLIPRSYSSITFSQRFHEMEEESQPQHGTKESVLQAHDQEYQEWLRSNYFMFFFLESFTIDESK